MNLPEIGTLNRRVEIYELSTAPDDETGAENSECLKLRCWASISPVGGQIYWGSAQVENVVTHRIIVRSMRGTRPEDLQHITRIRGDGMSFLVKRVTDINGDHRFTAIECEAQDAAL